MENKWWEYYVVRYFVGTVVGALLVAFLITESGSPFAGHASIIGSSAEANFLGVSLTAALGFAFCYIASSPILTLHTARAHMRLSASQTSKLALFLKLMIPAFITVGVFWYFLPRAISVSLGLVIGTQFGFILLAISTNFSVIEFFYRELAIARAEATPEKDQKPTAGIEYVTSYRHLREHGNAFMIVILEGVLAYALAHTPSLSCASVVLAIWLLPATFAWLAGTVLEIRFVSTPLP